MPVSGFKFTFGVNEHLYNYIVNGAEKNGICLGAFIRNALRRMINDEDQGRALELPTWPWIKRS